VSHSGPPRELRRVAVSAPSRLHFGLLNESGYEGRVDGGVGAALMSPRVELEVTAAAEDTLTGAVSDELATSVKRLLVSIRMGYQEHKIPSVALQFVRTIPEHKGFGSKTATLLAVCRGLAAAFDLHLDLPQMVSLTRRGGTSGIGSYVSEFGGFVIDEGRHYPEQKKSFVPSCAAEAALPALRAHLTAAESWRVVLVDIPGEGASGQAEQQFFQANCPVPHSETELLYKLLNEMLIPSLLAEDIDGTNDALGEMQYLGLKGREWGVQPAFAQELRARWSALDGGRWNTRAPLCLSSMGTTLFLLTDQPELMAEALTLTGMPITPGIVGLDNAGAQVVLEGWNG
jgi:beta-ribofuranosylaminobenzene 5'-phosphate synthase